MSLDQFFQSIDTDDLTALDRAVAILWYAGRQEPNSGLSAKNICDVLERNGHPRQNQSRLADNLRRDRRIAKASENCWKLVPSARKQLNDAYSRIIPIKFQLPESDSVLPRELFEGTRGYLSEVVRQLNASYDAGLFDCCAVMSRRLLETLLIELYESNGRALDIKAGDGNFLMFAPLLSYFERDAAFHMSRNGLKGLRDFKQLGDLSAHNRRFNAKRDDVDRIRDGLRIASGELLVMARLQPA